MFLKCIIHSDKYGAMNLKSIQNFSAQEINSCINNINTGIEYEYALFYALLPDAEKAEFRQKIVELHPFKERINTIIAQLDFSNIIEELAKRKFKPTHYFLSTQDDSVGPSDIVLGDAQNNYLGLSVKFNNSCQLNVSGKHFLSPENCTELSKEHDTYYHDYISEMTAEHGNITNWFRKRKKSKVTDQLIDTIRDGVIESWTAMDHEQKKSLLTRLLQVDSPIPYVIVTIKPNAAGLTCLLKTDLEYKIDYQKIKLVKHQTSLIRFNHDRAILGDMQVKFNNGILEKGTVANRFQIVAGISLKKGNPISSWNFSLK